MDVRLELYRIFCAAAEQKSFSGAAKELYITQSAVSQAIGQLEAQIGVCLFLRSSKGVSLSTEGKMLYEYIRSALGLITTAEEKLQRMAKLELGELNICAGDTASKYLLLPCLEAFHTQYPQVKLRIINRTSSEGAKLLRDGQADLAFLNLSSKESELDASLEVQLSFPVHDVFIAGTRFSYLKGEKISLSALSSLPLILLETKANSRKYVQAFFKEHGVEIRPDIELGSHELLLEFAGIGLGISCAIREFSHDYLAKENVFELSTTPTIPPRTIGMCSLRGVSLSAAAKEFRQIVLKYQARRGTNSCQNDSRGK